ncbi:MAG: hypothetical protein ABIT08_12610 [Bacteroidia bacterium]
MTEINFVKNLLDDQFIVEKDGQEFIAITEESYYACGRCSFTDYEERK